MPWPSLADTCTASKGSRPRSDSISSLTRSTSAAGKIDLVDDRQQLELVLESQVHVGHGLSFDPLGSIDEKKRTFTGHQRTTHLVREIDVSGRVDEVELIGLAVLRLVASASPCCS